MNSFLHAKSSAKKYGGILEDYVEIHNFIDSSKATIADVRHRGLFHNSMGPFVAERIFGVCIKNSIGKDVSVRQICEDHIIEDLGFIPSVDKWLGNMAIQPWMGGSMRNRKRISFEELKREKIDV